jgi:hypothetical protein
MHETWYSFDVSHRVLTQPSSTSICTNSRLNIGEIGFVVFLSLWLGEGEIIVREEGERREQVSRVSFHSVCANGSCLRHIFITLVSTY